MRRFSISALALLLVLAGTAVAQGPRLRAQVDRQRVYEGESFLYQVTLSHATTASEPELPQVEGLKVEFLGQAQMLSSSFSITINGRQMQSRNDQGWRYQYRMTPLKPGRITIPAATATVDGTKIVSQPIDINVVGPIEQDVANVEIITDHSTVYPLQPFTVTLKVFIKALPGNFAATDPTHDARLDRRLTVPWADDRTLSANLAPTEDLNEWLGPLQSREGFGFNINNLGSPGVFTLFGNNSSTFELQAKKITKLDKDGKEAEFWEYTLSRTFVAKAAGKLDFGPATLKGRFAAGLLSRNQFNLEEVYAVAPVLTITVQDVPTQGRPDSYTGAVGTFTFHADLTPRQAKVGDPMTLTLTLRGDGLLETAGAPDLEKVPAVAEAFKVYEATEEMKESERVFTYSIRPQVKGVTEFPAVPISYFNTAEEKYVTVYTDPLPVEIGEADKLSVGDIVASGPMSDAPRPIETAKGGIYANMATAASLYDHRVHPERWYGGLAALLATYGAASVFAARVRSRKADPALQRRRAAARRARSRWEEGKKLASSDPLRAADLYRAACLGLIADAAGVEEAGLTVKDVDQLSKSLGIDESVTMRVHELIDRCEGARYTGLATGSESSGMEAQSVLVSLIEALKSKGYLT